MQDGVLYRGLRELGGYADSACFPLVPLRFQTVAAPSQIVDYIAATRSDTNPDNANRESTTRRPLMSHEPSQRKFLKTMLGGAAGVVGLATAGSLLTPRTAS